MSSWDDEYASGKWDYLASAAEAARYVLIANYLDRFCGGGPVLDVGCGEGLLCRYVNHARYQFTGVDVSRIAIQRAMQHHPASSWFAVDAAEFPSRYPAKFHAIVFNEILYYVPDIAGILAAYAKLLSGPSLVVVSAFLPADHQPEWIERVNKVWEAVGSVAWTTLDDCLLEDRSTGIRWRIAAFRSAGGSP